MENRAVVLVVDDEATNVDYVANILSPIYTIKAAYNAQQAFKILEKVAVDLILLDVNMPDMNGFEVAKTLQKNKLLNHISIIFLTGNADTESIVKGFECGAKDYVTKPFNRAELLVRVENHINTQRLQRELEEKIEEIQEQQKIMLQQSKLAAMGEMISAIAHQWRQPLNAVGVLAQEIQLRFQYGSIDKDEVNKLTGELQEYLEYMSKTIDDFRNFFKPSKQKQPFDIVKAIEDSLRITKQQLYHHDVNVIFSQECSDKALEADENAYMYEGFESEFKQVVINIINNAREALEEHAKEVDLPQKEIKINVIRTSDDLIVRIRDNGGGIKEEIMEEMFEPYRSTKHAQQGTGLGLYMSKLIIERNMHGKLCARNVPLGAEFEITLHAGGS